MPRVFRLQKSDKSLLACGSADIDPVHPATNEQPTIFRSFQYDLLDQFCGTLTFLSASLVSRQGP
jgi:hypothetical protein